MIAVDISDDKLELAKSLGAAVTINARNHNAVEAIREVTKGGAHVAVDALGIAATCQRAVMSLRKRGRHLQIGLTTREEQGMVPLPIDVIVQLELSVIGSLGMQAPRFPAMLQMVESGRLQPGKMVTRRISIDEAGEALASMTEYSNVGVTVVDRW